MGNEIREPFVGLSLISADLPAANAAQKVLMVGPKIAAGTATSGALIENIENNGAENGLFGRDSFLAEMVRMFKRIAPQVQLDVIPLAENGSGVPATYTITVGGTTASEAGTLGVTVGSAKYHTFSVAVAVGDTPTAVALKIVDAVNADLNCPFNAGSAAGVVTLTATTDGTLGNNQPIAVNPVGMFAGSISGLTFTVAAGATGSADPTELSSTAIFDVVGNRRYQGVVWPYYTNFATLRTFLDARFNVNNRIVDGVGFVPAIDTYSNLLAILNAINSQSLVFVCDLQSNGSLYRGPANQEPLYLQITALAAIRALRLTPNASISQYLTSNASRDQFGGVALASLPYFNTTIPQLSITRTGLGFTEIEIEGLKTAGGTVMGQNSPGTNHLVGEVVTTYKTDPAGNPDPSWKFLNYVDTMSNVREYFFNNYKKRFAQSRLTEGNVQYGRDMVNKAVFEAYTDQLYGDLASPDYVLTQAGEAAIDYFKANRIVELDLASGTINVDMKTPIVTQTRNIIGTIQISFSTEGN